MKKYVQVHYFALRKTMTEKYCITVSSQKNSSCAETNIFGTTCEYFVWKDFMDTFCFRPEIWFDDVDEDLLDLEVRTPIQGKPATGASKKTETTGESKKETSKTANLLVKERSFEG